VKRPFKAAYERVSEILFAEDPIGINFDDNTDEYEPEASTILPRLRTCRSVEDVQQVVHEEFVKWFDASTAGSPERYEAVAQRIWENVVPSLTH
jgi:hypothetical protein